MRKTGEGEGGGANNPPRRLCAATSLLKGKQWSILPIQTQSNSQRENNQLWPLISRGLAKPRPLRSNNIGPKDKGPIRLQQGRFGTIGPTANAYGMKTSVSFAELPKVLLQEKILSETSMNKNSNTLLVADDTLQKNQYYEHCKNVWVGRFGEPLEVGKTSISQTVASGNQHKGKANWTE